MGEGILVIESQGYFTMIANYAPTVLRPDRSSPSPEP